MAKSSSKPKGRKGKIGKNKARIAVYYNSGRNVWNKARVLVHHLRRQDDPKAAETLRTLGARMGYAMQREFQIMYRI